MLPAERKRRIVELVNERDGASVAALAGELEFSKATIRRDLKELAEEGQVERSHGGAVPASSVGTERSFGQREVDNLEAKEAIAARAVEELRDGEVVFFDAGSTTTAVANAVPADAGIQAVTNMPEIGIGLLETAAHVSVTGGTLRERTRALVGPAAEAYLDRTHFDCCFLGVNSVTPDGELSTPNEDEAAVKRTIVERSSRIVLVTDATKFGERSFVRFASAADIDVLITDEAPTGDLGEALAEANVTVEEVAV